MSGRWRKLGLLYAPPDHGQHPALLTHAANPLAVHLDGDVFRIFFSGRDAQQRSSVAAVDIDILRRAIVCHHPRPFLEPGPAGSLHADGVSPGNCYRVGNERYMLFMGWQNPPGEHWHGEIGRVRLTATLGLADVEPLLGLDPTDPISLSYPWVLQTDEPVYEMWYGSTHSWDAGNGEMLHLIHHARSTDGRHWQREGVALPFVPGRMQACSRPAVLPARTQGLDMWFSCRGGQGDRYRIAHAKSIDRRSWQPGAAGLDVSASGWDSEMVGYPFVFDHRGQRYMLYNGNGYGRSGFGLAVLDAQ